MRWPDLAVVGMTALLFLYGTILKGFSLRSLFIATTLVAVVLGLIVYAVK